MNLGQPATQTQGGQPYVATEGMIPPQASAPDPVPEQSDGDDELSRRPYQLIEKTNIATELSEEELTKIGSDAKQGFDTDVFSRQQWETDTEEWLKLAAQVKEEKWYPWRGAANVKYPLISTAALQFAARAYPSLIPSDGKIVSAKIFGSDPTGQKSAKAERVSKYMSFQVMQDMDYWEEDMDQLLISVPVMGMCFKKTYWDALEEKLASKLIYPDNLVVNYWTWRLEDASRVSEIMYLTKRQILERQRKGLYLDIDLGSPPVPENYPTPIKTNPGNVQTVDPTLPFTMIEQHTWLDLDDDGLDEPYIVTFQRETGRVVRITARFTSDDITLNEDNEVVKITPISYYTKFGFIPNPDGSFYDLGFGHLLGPLNESVNTIINQLLDAGTLNNLQSGFIGKGLRLKMGESNFSPGEWKVVNAVGDDLKKQIVPLPTKEPSSVLYQLLGTLITSGKELASVAEIFTGKMPGQNTPATTTMATIDQGMKVFTAIYKRLYRALDREFAKIFRVDRTFLSDDAYNILLDEKMPASVQMDFDQKTYDIIPGSDPTGSAQTDKMAKAQALLQLLQLGTIDPMEVTIRNLQAQEQPDWEKLIPGMVETGKPQPPPQKPDPKVQAMQQKAQLDQQKAQVDVQVTQQKLAMEQQAHQADLQSKAQEHAMEMQAMIQKQKIESQGAIQKNQIQMAQAQQDLHANALEHLQSLKHAEEQNKSKIEMQRLAARNGSNGTTATSQRPSSKK